MVISALKSIVGGKQQSNKKRIAIEPLKDGSRTVISVGDAIANKPDWVKFQISTNEALAMSAEIKKSGAQSALEVGIASGFSSAILYSALAQNTTNPKLYSLDWSKQCYFEKTRLTGDAFHEIHGNEQGYSLTTELHTGMISTAPTVDFCFIDANHQNPWPAFDLMGLGRFIKHGAVVALHDFEMIFHHWGRHASGARDLYRCWLGEKWRREGSSNVGFLRFDAEIMMRSLPAVFMTDWDLKVRPETVDYFIDIARTYPSKYSGAIIDAIAARAESAENVKLQPKL